MFLVLFSYSRFALVLVLTLRSVSNCREESRKKDEDRQWTEWTGIRRRRTVLPISQESLAFFPGFVVVSGKRKIDYRVSRIKGPYIFHYFLNGKKDKSGTKGTKKMRNN